MSEQLIARLEIVDVARTWLGAPYIHQGRSRKGVDCIGLIMEVGSDLGLTIPMIPKNYTTNPTGGMLVASCEAHLQKAAQDQVLQPGSIAVLWGFTRGEPQHFAIVGQSAGKLTMIHAFSKHRKVIEHGWDAFWMKRFVRVYEFPGTTAGSV